MNADGIETLTKATNDGFGHWKRIEDDSTLDPLRAEPEFAALLARKPAETIG